MDLSTELRQIWNEGNLRQIDLGSHTVDLLFFLHVTLRFIVIFNICKIYFIEFGTEDEGDPESVL
jgi:hypothetical protein